MNLYDVTREVYDAAVRRAETAEKALAEAQRERDEARADAHEAEYATLRQLRARVALLERVIEEAEHAPWCAFKDVAGARLGDHDGRCDCFKSKASVQ